VVIAREAFERDGVVTELDRVLVYRIQDDLLAECWVYDGDQALVDGFLRGLGEPEAPPPLDLFSRSVVQLHNAIGVGFPRDSP
jgi:hypothetical protein